MRHNALLATFALSCLPLGEPALARQKCHADSVSPKAPVTSRNKKLASLPPSQTIAMYAVIDPVGSELERIATLANSIIEKIGHLRGETNRLLSMIPNFARCAPEDIDQKVEEIIGDYYDAYPERVSTIPGPDGEIMRLQCDTLLLVQAIKDPDYSDWQEGDAILQTITILEREFHRLDAEMSELLGKQRILWNQWWRSEEKHRPATSPPSSPQKETTPYYEDWEEVNT